MLGFPIEIITLLGSGLLAGFLKFQGAKLDMQKAKHEMKMERRKFENQAISSARSHKGVGFQWTRRIIALSSVGAIIILPKVAPFVSGEIPIVYTWTEISGGFWPFFDSVETVEMKATRGILLTPLDTHLVSSIIGMYFGGSLVGHKGK